jgi:hypothetical protein
VLAVFQLTADGLMNPRDLLLARIQRLEEEALSALNVLVEQMPQ